MFFGVRMGDDVGALSQIVDHQCDKDEVPGPDDRFAAQMPHVGIERLAAGGAEDDLGQDEETGQAVIIEKSGGIPGTE